MVIGVLTAELAIDGADSLKDKRQALKSLLAHLRNKFNVSAAEVADHDFGGARRSASPSSPRQAFAHAVLDKVVDHIERDPRVDLGHYEIELL